MPEALTKDEIKELAQLLVKIRHDIFNATGKVADKLSVPPVPAILGESIIYHILDNLENKSDFQDLFDLYSEKKSVHFGGVSSKERKKRKSRKSESKQGSDILVMLKNKKEISIEVKSTSVTKKSKNPIVGFLQKDISADYFVWIHFGRFFGIDSTSKIEINVLKNPWQYGDIPIQPTRTSLTKFKKLDKVQEDLISKEFEPSNLWLS